MFLLLFSLVQLSSSSPKQFFLQAEWGSRATIGSGIESVSESISTLSSSLSDSIHDIDSSIESSVSSTYTYSASVLSGRIVELEERLLKLNTQIAETSKEIALLSEQCEEFGDCTGCSNTANCVWCSGGFCAEGDESGPYQNECSDFLYQECENESCKDFDTCSSCTASDCGWCDSLRTCFLSEADDSQDCPDSEYYHIDKNVCPAETDSKGEMGYVDAYVFSNPTQSNDYLKQDLEQFLMECTEKALDIQQEIDVLKYSIGVLEEQAEEVNEIEVGGISVQGFSGVAQAAEELYEQEVAASRASEEAFAQDAADYVVETTTLAIDENTLLVLEEIEETTMAFNEDLDELEEELSLQIAELESDLDEIDTEETSETSETSETDADTSDAEVE